MHLLVDEICVDLALHVMPNGMLVEIVLLRHLQLLFFESCSRL